MKKPEINVHAYPTTEGINVVCEYLKTGYLSEKILGRKANWLLSRLRDHRIYPTHGFNERETLWMQRAVEQMALQLMRTSLSLAPQTEQEQPFAYGETAAEQLKTLSGMLNMKRFAEDILHRNLEWIRGRMRKKGEGVRPIYQEHIDEINEGIRRLALYLMSIRFQPER